MIPAGLQYVVSVSTKLATFPSSSIPLELKRVPARLHDRREMRERNEGSLEDFGATGAAVWGIVMVPQKPRMAEVKILELSKASLSGGISRDLNLIKGLIMNEFQRKPSSKLSISNVLLAGLPQSC